MAKKAPAKKLPAKRKPRPKKPVVPKPADFVDTDVMAQRIEHVAAYNELAAAAGWLSRKRIDRTTGEVEIYEPSPPPKPPALGQTLGPGEYGSDEGEPVDITSWIPPFLKAVLLIGLGFAAGVWSAGGIDISPDNKPTPVVPEPVKSFRVIFVKESGQTLSGEQVAIPGAKEIRDFLNAKTTPEGNQPGWREYDPQQITDNEQPTMKALWNAVKPQLLPAPCLVIEVNGKATVMPFPATVAEAVETLKKHGGA